jgi:hypothetical protein
VVVDRKTKQEVVLGLESEAVIFLADPTGGDTPGHVVIGNPYLVAAVSKIHGIDEAQLRRYVFASVRRAVASASLAIRFGSEVVLEVEFDLVESRKLGSIRTWLNPTARPASEANDEPRSPAMKKEPVLWHGATRAAGLIQSSACSQDGNDVSFAERGTRSQIRFQFLCDIAGNLHRNVIFG